MRLIPQHVAYDSGNGMSGKESLEDPELPAAIIHVCSDGCWVSSADFSPANFRAALEAIRRVSPFSELVHHKRAKRCRLLPRLADKFAHSKFLADGEEFSARTLVGGRKDTGVAISISKARSGTKYSLPESNVDQLGALSQIAPVGLLQIDLKWNAIYVNNNWFEMCGLSADEVNGRKWVQAIHPDDAEHALASMHRSFLSLSVYKGEFRIRTPLGETLWVFCTASPVRIENAAISYLLILQDISSLHDAQDQLKALAHYDPLTKLANRALLDERMANACARARRGAQLAVLFVDLDGFKLVNDSYGHRVGDELLKTVAHRLQMCVREEDTIARTGGDEFIIILENIRYPTDSTKVAENILASLSCAIHIDGEPQIVTASIGIALPDMANSDADELLRQADSAMYRAKQAGKSTYRFYTDDMSRSAERHLALIRELRSSRIKQDFCLHFQPQYDTVDGYLLGHEALLRWQRSNGEWVSPAEFIPILEQTHLIHEISDWVFHCALSSHQRWLRDGLVGADTHIAINLSPQLFLRNSVASQLADYLSLYDLDPKQVIVEVTESILLDERITNVHEDLRKISELGVRLSLDDFGTGFSSLYYLKKFPIDQVKIDKSFVKDIFEESNDAGIIGAILHLARALNLEVVAEGIEDAETSEYLTKQGCTLQQGFYLGRPDPHPAPMTLRELEPNLESGSQSQG